MVKTITMIAHQGDPSPNPDFLLAYQRAILHTLQESGALTVEQLAECISLLEGKAHRKRLGREAMI